MSSNIAEIAVEATPTLNPLDFIPSPGGYSGRCSRGQEAELENEYRSRRFRWQLSCLPTNGWCHARLNSNCSTQGASSRDLPTANEGLRRRYQPYASQLSARVRWNHCVSRRYSADRPGRYHRRNRLFRRNGFPGRSGEQGRSGSDQQAADGDQMIQIMMESGSAIWRKEKT
jgi:hypothetical protein